MVVRPTSRSLDLVALGAAMLLAAMATNASAATLTADAQGALIGAIDDEYHAEAVYDAAIVKFGPVRPFINIIKAERRHQEMLVELFQTYGLAVPANPYLNGETSIAPLPDSLAEVCKLGVDAEIANRDLYSKQLLPKVTEYPDITGVLQALRDASEYQHLPAFQKCAN